MEDYNHKKIETKWQKRWAESGLYKTPENPKDPHYVLDMFPYPSGSGLHVGHVEGYTGTDVYARFLRMQGKDVLHPMGWDAFGLPAENYAVKTGVHPRETTNEAIKTFKGQIDRLGLSYDWQREINTSLPDYYRFTQWLFLELFENDLAEKKPAKVNWCPSCQTVLANEQVVDGECDRCGHEVTQKEMDQWFFRITKYADELIDDLEDLDWPTSTKQAQRSWVGRQEGAQFSFAVPAADFDIEVFTTRPDTLFGVTYLAVAPEHRLVAQLLENKDQGLKNKSEVEEYIKKAEAKTDRERQENKEKTGVNLEGVTAKHPATGEEIPIFVADYVLGGYGTGAIMAVPAHDTRDHAFAEKYDIPIRQVVVPAAVLNTPRNPNDIAAGATEELRAEVELPWLEKGELVNSGEFDGLDSQSAQEKITEKYGQKETTYRLRDWSVGRQRLWGCPIPIVYDPEGEPHAVPGEHLPWTLPDDVPFEPTGEAPLAKSRELKERTEEIFGKGWTPETSTLDTFVDSSWYFLRFTDPENEREFAGKEAVKDWCPVDTYVGGAEHSVMHLLYARFITKALADLGYVDFREPFTKLRHQGLIMAADGTKMSKSKGNVVNPNEVVEQVGADTLRLYELFAGPFAETLDWNTDAIAGPRRFLERVWRLATEVEGTNEDVTVVPADDQALHRAIKAVGEDIAAFKFNTAISSLMELANEFQDREVVARQSVATFLRLLAPLAPHIAEELWEQMGGESSVHTQPWPEYDEKALTETEVTIAIQVDGKVRGEIKVAKETDEMTVLKLARTEENVASYLEKNAEIRHIYVPNRLVNFVTEK